MDDVARSRAGEVTLSMILNSLKKLFTNIFQF
jgi:hypothetical protein